MTTSVIVVEDNTNLLQSIQSTLSEHREYRVIGVATSIEQASALVDEEAPDVLLTDLGLPDGNGVDLIRETSQKHPSTLIMVLSMFGDEKSVVDAILAGAKGYLVKQDNVSELPASILLMTEGGSPLSPSIARFLLTKLQGRAPNHDAIQSKSDQSEGKNKQHRLLSPRESEVLELISRGYRSKEIARDLGISYHTVVHHIRSVYDKLAVSSRSQAIFKATQLGELR